ncbi:MAG: nicotinate-nucleotide--dimethylbenzimidazole phosphoribosyltransferase [Proteobacteria bacterium]|nr:MAG: nicotinate-nucleotide--dimethylbenzimidazole phosphoribosyltransferase [Pseudomonadota bacterium]PIE40265.1 MAG: nicotinate-nucleotide--dimethylbenzimidazole phosphoribosyltransferase [Gammaproteobacteria bacterium]
MPVFTIKPLELKDRQKLQARIDNKTKPPGSLGRLEALALQLALVSGQSGQERAVPADKIEIERPAMLVFAGDHGIAREGISIAPPEVTQQMVVNFLQGGAAINCFCRTNDIRLEVIDAGMLCPVEHENIQNQSLGRGTNNMAEDCCMSIGQVERGLLLGRAAAERNIDLGSNVLGFGEMGIGNTSSASAIQCCLMDLEAEACVGRGTGIDDSQFDKKTALVEKALAYHRARVEDLATKPLEIMASFAGFEIVQMTGAMLATAEHRKIILVDGYIATAAAMLAIRMNKNCQDYMVFCHESGERGHQLMLQELGAEPLLRLGLRLGEGTGAALAVPLLRAAAGFYNDMASFEAAGVTAV